MRLLASIAGLAAIVASLLACDRPLSILSARATATASAIRPTLAPTVAAVPSATATALPTATRPPSPTAAATATPTLAPTVTPAARSTAIQGDLIISGPVSEKKVAMTFDMGSVGGSTLQLLDVLRARGVRATFFVTGKWAEANPEVMKAIVAGGHELANHSYTHPDFTTIAQVTMIEELQKTEEIVKRVANVSSKPYFRPPFGAYNATTLKVVAEQGYKSIYWTVDSTDWRDDSTVSSVIAWTLKNIEPGGILVMHGALQKTADAVPAILEGMRSKGMQPTSLSDLLKS